MPSHDIFKPGVTHSDFGVYVTHQNDQNLSWILRYDRWQPLVKLSLVVAVATIGGCVTLDNIRRDFLLCFEGRFDDSGFMRFPSHKQLPVCGAYSLSSTESNSISPESKLFCPNCVQWVSLILNNGHQLSTVGLQFLTSIDENYFGYDSEYFKLSDRFICCSKCMVVFPRGNILLLVITFELFVK